jgi:hypothetical protein
LESHNSQVYKQTKQKETNKQRVLDSESQDFDFFGGFVFLFTKEEIEESGIQESCRRGERERNGKEMHGENPYSIFIS